jgi:hypothetical protein
MLYDLKANIPEKLIKVAILLYNIERTKIK